MEKLTNESGSKKPQFELLKNISATVLCGITIAFVGIKFVNPLYHEHVNSTKKYINAGELVEELDKYEIQVEQNEQYFENIETAKMVINSLKNVVLDFEPARKIIKKEPLKILFNNSEGSLMFVEISNVINVNLESIKEGKFNNIGIEYIFAHEIKHLEHNRNGIIILNKLSRISPIGYPNYEEYLSDEFANTRQIQLGRDKKHSYTGFPRPFFKNPR